MNHTVTGKNRNRLGEIIVFIMAFLFASCQEDKVPKPPVSLEDMASCYTDYEWNENKITDELIGKWQCEYITCFWSPELAQYVLDSNLTVEFMTDSFLIVKQNDEILQTSRWEIVDRGSNLYSINDNPSNYLFFGIIIICDERVLFHGSFADLCDNYFKRIQ